MKILTLTITLITTLLASLTAHDHIVQQSIWALFGVLLYNWLSFTIEKDKFDSKSETFNFRDYASKRWDNWIWSLLCVPLIVAKGDQLWYYVMAYYEKDWQFLDILYLSAGVVAEGFYWLLKKMFSLIAAIGNDK